MKRWYFARPGTVERHHAVSSKYDAWAVLSKVALEDLAACDGTPDSFFSVDLFAGDVLHVPAGWWHQVHNIESCLMFGGFYGPVASVAARWIQVQATDLFHRAGWVEAGNCTCHQA